MTRLIDDPHRGQLVLRQGPPAAQARLAVIMAHGRGGSAQDLLGFAAALRLDDVLFLAPQAAGSTWYPYTFLAPLEKNEPHLTSALQVIADQIKELEAAGLPSERVALAGYSQGGCLSLEYAARNARRYAAVIGLSAGLIGPPGMRRDYSGSFQQTPAFLGCSDIDPHIPVDRVHETAEWYRRLHATVDERIYPGMGHTIIEDEIEAVRSILSP